MSSILEELKRRNVFKVGFAYLVLAWLLIQIASVLLPTFEAPAWAMQTFTLFTILGFPLALFFAWAFEVTPEGIKPTKAVDPAESIARLTGRKIDFVIIGVLVLALGFFVVDKYLPGESPQEVASESAGQTVELAAESAEPPPPPPESETPVLPNSVAVLPFDNLSPNPDDAYFAAGIHEEVLNYLAKLSALNVIARTSVLQYADGSKAIPEIAGELNVETVMEGSVRYAGDRVRITAQLIDADTGAHLWSDAYERDFEDIFAIQADIAMNIANALEAEFSLDEQAKIEELPTTSTEAYTHYLNALQRGGFERRGEQLDRAIEIDPEFAAAYAAKALNSAQRVQLFAFGAPPGSAEELGEEALTNAATALGLDPTIGKAHAAMGMVHLTRWRWAEAGRALEQAARFSPSDPLVLRYLATYKRSVGEYSESVELMKKAALLSPTDWTIQHQYGVSLLFAHEFEAAIEPFQANLRANPRAMASAYGLAFIDAARGDAEGAAERASSYRESMQGQSVSPGQVVWGMLLNSLAGNDEEARRMFELLEEHSSDRQVGAAMWGLAHLALGEHDAGYDWLNKALENREVSDQLFFAEIKSNYYGLPVLEEPRFRELRDQFGSLE